MKRSIVIIYFFLFAFQFSFARNPRLPVVDSHCHIKTTAEEPYITMEEYFAENKSVDVKYLFGLTIAPRGEMDKVKIKNDSLMSMSRRDARFVPVCSVHPHDGGATVAELKRIKEAGGRIIKLHPISQNFQILDEKVVNLVRAAGEMDLVVLMDGYGFLIPDYLDNLLQLSLVCPETKFIIAHMGGTDFFKLASVPVVKLAAPSRFSNVWYDISATIMMYAGSPYREQMEWVIKSIGTDRFLFGTDNPIATFEEALTAFYKFDFGKKQQEQILYENAIELLRLKNK